jgi:hypothetical protein
MTGPWLHEFVDELDGTPGLPRCRTLARTKHSHCFDRCGIPASPTDGADHENGRSSESDTSRISPCGGLYGESAAFYDATLGALGMHHILGV